MTSLFVQFLSQMELVFSTREMKKVPKALASEQRIVLLTGCLFRSCVYGCRGLAHNSRGSIARLLLSLKRQLWQMNDLQISVAFLILKISPFIHMEQRYRWLCIFIARPQFVLQEKTINWLNSLEFRFGFGLTRWPNMAGPAMI